MELSKLGKLQPVGPIYKLEDMAGEVDRSSPPNASTVEQWAIPLVFTSMASLSEGSGRLMDIPTRKVEVNDALHVLGCG